MPARLHSDSLERAAAMIADERGLDAVTMSSVADHLGVRAPSLYGHVRDRAGLLDRLSVHALHLLAEELAVALSGHAGRDALLAFATANRRFAARSPGLWAAMQRPLDAATVAESDGRRVSALAAGALRAYPVPEGDVVHAVRFLGATVHGFIGLERTGGFAHSRPGVDESWTQAIDALHALFTAWPATGTHEPRKGGTP